MNSNFSITGNIVDVVNRRIYAGTISVTNGKIVSIAETDENFSVYIIPGFVDAHVHVESSLLPPSHFAAAALKHGVLGAVTDPHEIANVCGLAGIQFMYNDSANVPFYFKIGAPSCVPATHLETSGVSISPHDIEWLFNEGICSHLSEVMNFPGVINGDAEVLAKISSARKRGMVIDGHAPSITGDALLKYIFAGISTDHECTTLKEAHEKLLAGMKILIREGSAAKNLNALKYLIPEYTNNIMLCTDDMHSDSILGGYLLPAIRSLLNDGFSVFDVFQMAGLNACKHYGIDMGQLQIGDNADFVLVDSLNSLNVQSVFLKGKEVSNIVPSCNLQLINNFGCTPLFIEDVKVIAKSNSIRCIKIKDTEIVTDCFVANITSSDGLVNSDTANDILKVLVVNRYHSAKPAVGFVSGFGLKSGAIASSISHDSHNIICIGVSDDDIVTAINAVINAKGGLSYAINNEVVKLELPIAGLMSYAGIELLAKQYSAIEGLLKSNGCLLSSPLMNLSFLSLLVVPELKIGDKGLFDFKTFSYIDLFV